MTRFVSKFRGIAAELPIRADSKSSSQTGEVLAINLLKIANLSESTLTNAKLRLIGMVGEISRNEDQDSLKVSLDLEEEQKIVSSVQKWLYACLAAEIVRKA